MVIFVSMPIAVITGDIISSRNIPEKSLQLSRMKSTFAHAIDVAGPARVEVFRGDSFQLELSKPENALKASLLIRSGLKAIPEFYKRKLDVRMAIGIGKKGYRGKTVNESDGEAYQFSGLLSDTLKKMDVKLAIRTPWEAFDEEMNVSFKLVSAIIDEWSQVSAETVWLQLIAEKTQEQLARKLKISQPAVHKRIHKSHFSEIRLLEERFRKEILRLT